MYRPDPLALALGAALLLLLAGCDPSAGDDDDTTGDDDDTAEAGCITINGEVPGFAHLQDAINAATDGDVISVCAGTYSGSVVIENGLTILGAASATTILEGDVNEMAVTIRQTEGVKLSGFTVSSTRNGIAVEDATDVVLEDLIVSDSGQVGIQVDGSQVRIAVSTLTVHPFAAIDASDSSLDVDGCTIGDIAGYGIRLVDSDAVIVDTDISDIRLQDEPGEDDGTCILARDARGPISVDGVTVDGCDRVGIYGLNADLEVTNSAVSSCANGIAGLGPGEAGGSVISGSTIDECPLFGVLLADQAATVEGNTLTVTDPGDNTYGIAVGQTDGTFTVSDNEVSGYGRGGIWVQYPFTDPAPTGGTAILHGNTVADVNLYGILATDLDSADIQGNDVHGIRWSGALSNGAYGDGFGMSLWTIDELTMADNRVFDVDVVGVFVQEATFTSTDDAVTDNHLWGLYISEAAGTFTGLSLERNAITAADIRTADVTFEYATVVDTVPAVPPELWEDPEPYEYSGTGLSITESQASFVGCTLTDNDAFHMTLQSTDIQLQDSLLTGDTTYGLYAFYLFGNISGNEFRDVEDAIYLWSSDADEQIGDLTIEDNTFSEVGNGIRTTYLARTVLIENNVFTSTIDYSGYGSDGYGVYAADYDVDGALVELRDNSFDDLANSAVYAFGVDLEVSGGNTVDGIDGGYSAIHLQQVDGTVDGLTVAGSSGPGMVVDGSTLTVTGCSFTGSLADNLRISSSSVSINDNLAFSDGATNGIRLEGAITGSLTGNTIAGNAEYGISCDGAAVVLDACVNTMAGNGITDIKEENGCVLGCVAE
jgi:hypothetical protein